MLAPQWLIYIDTVCNILLLLVILHRHLNGYIEFNIHSISKNLITIDYVFNQKMFTIHSTI
jgi:hypothetical protein